MKGGLVGFSEGEIVLEASTLYVDSALDQACYLNVNLSPDKVPAAMGRLDFSIEEYFLDSLSDRESTQDKEDKKWMLIHMGIWEWKFDARPNVSDVRVWRRFFGLLVKEVSRGSEKVYERLGIVEARFRFPAVTEEFQFLTSNEAFMREWKRETVRIV